MWVWVHPRLESGWLEVLKDEFTKPYFAAIKQSLLAKKSAGETIYPPPDKIFQAFELTPLDEVKVVVLGQDPYHGQGQAHGLCFSVQEWVKIPPSLQNIFKEMLDDVGGSQPSHGNLNYLARQGVFLLNAILTVSAGKPASHRELGWEQFTDAVIHAISVHKEHVVFLLWGNFARSKRDLIDPCKHLILEAPHPSPYSASSGFYGSKHFSQANAYLHKHGKEPVQRL